MRVWPCVLILGVATSAIAQTGAFKNAIPPDQLVVAPNGVNAQCMARTTTKKDGHDWSFAVPVPAGKQADFAAKGFQPAACAAFALQLAKHKDIVCEIAKGNEAVQKQTEAALGVDARKLCAAAKMLIPDPVSTTNTTIPRPNG